MIYKLVLLKYKNDLKIVFYYILELWKGVKRYHNEVRIKQVIYLVL